MSNKSLTGLDKITYLKFDMPIETLPPEFFGGAHNLETIILNADFSFVKEEDDWKCRQTVFSAHMLTNDMTNLRKFAFKGCRRSNLIIEGNAFDLSGEAFKKAVASYPARNMHPKFFKNKTFLLLNTRTSDHL